MPDTTTATILPHCAGCDGDCDDLLPAPPITALGEDGQRELAHAYLTLHRTAHPGQPTYLPNCQLEPCRSLSFATVDAITKALS